MGAHFLFLFIAILNLPMLAQAESKTYVAATPAHPLPEPYFPVTPVLNPKYTNASGTLTIRSTVPQETRTQLISDLNSLFAIKASATHPLHLKKFGGYNGSHYKKYFYSLVDHINYDQEDTSGAFAYVGMVQFEINITSYYVHGKVPQIGRIGQLLHEANHNDDDHGSWLHAFCPKPFKDSTGLDVHSIFTGLPLAGVDACDDQAFGSYGTSVLFFQNVRDFCENCSAKSKWDADLYAKDQSERVIDGAAVRQLETNELTQLKKTNSERNIKDVSGTTPPTIISSIPLRDR